MFIDLQKKEIVNLNKERKKVRDKFFEHEDLRELREQPFTFRDWCIRQVWEEKNDKEKFANSWVTQKINEALSEENVGRDPNAEELRKLIKESQEKLEKMTTTLVKKAEIQNKRYEELKENEKRAK